MIDRFAAHRLLFVPPRMRPKARSCLKPTYRAVLEAESSFFGPADHAAVWRDPAENELPP